MLDYAREAVEMTAGRQRTNLDQDRMFQLALVRLVEVVGEAATRVSAEGQRRYDTIPWAEVRGLRNRLVHGYDIVDLNILWDIVQDDLPPLIAELERILEAL
jgi:uncharacterized protein with HEPN domain